MKKYKGLFVPKFKFNQMDYCDDTINSECDEIKDCRMCIFYHKNVVKFNKWNS